MCGICGIYHYNQQEPVTKELLAEMTRLMRHRGGDGDGTAFYQGAALGHRRLAILDRKMGNQPLSNAEETIWSVCNGEIYNYQDLRRQLQQSGYKFRTRTDTEVLPNLYEQYQENMLHFLRGIFGLAVYDQDKHRLLLARDRLGVKPLYYTVNNGHFYFASEIKPLLLCPGVEREVNHQGLFDYLTLRYVPAPFTLFRGIYKLQPGHLLVVENGNYWSEPYWDLMFQPKMKMSNEEKNLRFEELLRETVLLQLMGEVPMGIFLSGGLDSSLLLALITQMGTKDLTAFSIGFMEQRFQDELPAAEAAAQHIGIHLYKTVMSHLEFFSLLQPLTWFFEEPITEPSAVPTFYLSQLASKSVKVVFLGEGSDELFAGYPKYIHDSRARLLKAIPGLLKSLALFGVRRLPGGFRRFKLAIKVLSQSNDYKRWVDWFSGIHFDERQSFLSPDFIPDEGLEDFTERFDELLSHAGTHSNLEKMTCLDLSFWLPDNLLMKADKMTMSATIEARVPYLDHQLVEFVAKLPDEEKIFKNEGKHILKQFAAIHLPPEVLNRRKAGFPVPISLWLRQYGRDLLYDLLLSNRARERGYFNPKAIRKVIKGHMRGTQDYQRLLWTLLSLELWHLEFIDPESNDWSVRPKVGF